MHYTRSTGPARAYRSPGHGLNEIRSVRRADRRGKIPKPGAGGCGPGRVAEVGPENSVDSTLQETIATLKLDAEQVLRRRAFLEITEADLELVRRIAPRLLPHHARVMETFYRHLEGFEETRTFLRDPARVERLRHVQARYLTSLLEGRLDWSYVRERLRVGVVHQRIGLDARWYEGAYARHLRSLIRAAAEELGEADNPLLPVIEALLKLVFFDMGLVLDTYHAADRLEIEALRMLAETIVCNVPAGLLVADRELRILSANAPMEELTGRSHADLRGQPLEALFPGTGLHSRATEVLTGAHPRHIAAMELETPAGPRPVEVSIVPVTNPPQLRGGRSSPRLLLTIEDHTEQARLAEATRAADLRVRAIVDNVGEGIVTINEKGDIESFNAAAEHLFGYPAVEVIGRNVRMLMPEPYRSAHDGYLKRYLDSGERRCLGRGFREVEGRRKDGSVFPMELSINEMRSGPRRLFIGVVRDISARKSQEERMQILSSAVEQTADSVIITDAEGIIEYVNPAFEQVTGYSADEALGRRPNIVKSGVQGPDYYARLWQTIRAGEVFRDIIVNKRKDGALYYEEKTITPIRGPTGEIVHFVSTGKDITARMETEQRLQYLTHHDILTGLPNRALFADRLDQAIARSGTRGHRLALLLLNLDRFKVINDGLGHNAGDELLCRVAERLQEAVRPGDTVARLGGDEFAALLEDVPDEDEVALIARRILAGVAAPLELEGQALRVSASIGIAMYPADAGHAHDLLRHADVAMRRAKSKGRSSYGFYAAEVDLQMERRYTLEQDLHRALEATQFQLHFQPQIELTTGTMVGVEALLRWHHPDGGLISPADFVPVLEESGLIVPVGEWVIGEACRHLAAWDQAGLEVPRVAVNISPRQLSRPSLLPNLLAAARAHGVDPTRLELEITESGLMEDLETAIRMLGAVADAGIRIAMDDFGTGYSSLSHLRRLPIRVLKIDRSFIREVPEQREDTALARAIIALGNSLDLQVLAEGVETEEQAGFLRRQGCHLCQGFFYARPMPADELGTWLARR